MSIKKLLIIILFIVNTHNIYSADMFVIKELKFEGFQRINIDTTLLSIPIYVGKKITYNDISNTIRTLFATNNFENIQVLRDEDSIIIKVKERPIINNIIFSGNKILKEEMFKQNLDGYGISVGEILNPNIIFNLKKDLEDFYHNCGNLDAQINISTILMPYNKVNLKFIFNEGITAKIKQINIIGNYFFSKKELISYFNLQDEISWLNIINKQKYNKQKLEYDLENLRNFYFSHGYARFNIDHTQINLTPNKKDIYITINLTEGEQYKIADIFVNSNITDLSTKIKNLVKITSGELFDGVKISKIENDIKHFLDNFGYAYPQLTTKLEFNDFNKEVKVYINVDTGHRFYVRNIIIEGNHITKDCVLRREIYQMEGSWFSNDLVNQSKDRLYRLGYFETINTEIRDVPEVYDQVDIIYKVKECNTGNINFGAGFGTESGISFQFNIQQDNWLGTGNFIGLSGNKNDYQTYADFSMNVPYLTIDGISFNNKIFYNNFNANNADISEYDLRSYGFSTMLGLPIYENQSIKLGLDYVYENLTNIEPHIIIWRYLNSIDMNFKRTKLNKAKNYINFNANDFFLSTCWISNKLNRGYFPTAGSHTNFIGKVTLPFSYNKYYKINLNISHYIPLSKSNNWILIGRLRFGYASGLNGQDVPFYDHFYAGGANTVRGFRSNTIGPKAVYYKNNNTQYNNYLVNKSNDAIGGNSLIIASAELVIPTPFLDEKYINVIRTSLFIDSGTVWDSKWQNTSITLASGIPNYSNPNNIRFSSGISIQWMSPLGLLSFSFSPSIKKYDGDKLEQFQFNLGKTW